MLAPMSLRSNARASFHCRGCDVEVPDFIFLDPAKTRTHEPSRWAPGPAAATEQSLWNADDVAMLVRYVRAEALRLAKNGVKVRSP